MKRAILFFWILTVFVSVSSAAAQAQQAKSDDIAGEIFGTPVPMGNYYFAKRALMAFGTKWGAEPKTPQELEERVWDNLILSFEAFRRNIEVSRQELEDEVTRTLKDEKVSFDWKKDKGAYAKWLEGKLKENSELFENQLRYLIQIQKLRQQVLDSIAPEVREEEAYQEFLNEYNTLETELAQFDNPAPAKAFYKNAKANRKFWEEQRRENPKLFRQPGFVALEFLMDMWKFPKDDLYKMLKAKIGTIYPPIPIYGGKTGVVRVTKVRVAKKSEFPKLRQSYYEQIKMKKKYAFLDEWWKKFKEEANIKVYKKIAAQ